MLSSTKTTSVATTATMTTTDHLRPPPTITDHHQPPPTTADHLRHRRPTTTDNHHQQPLTTTTKDHHHHHSHRHHHHHHHHDHHHDLLDFAFCRFWEVSSYVLSLIVRLRVPYFLCGCSVEFGIHSPALILVSYRNFSLWFRSSPNMHSFSCNRNFSIHCFCFHTFCLLSPASCTNEARLQLLPLTLFWSL